MLIISTTAIHVPPARLNAMNEPADTISHKCINRLIMLNISGKQKKTADETNMTICYV
jgi:hypothetical protein